MSEVQYDNEQLTEGQAKGIQILAGFEVDMRRKSHLIPAAVYLRMIEEEKARGSDAAMADLIGIDRSRYRPISLGKRCSPATLIKIINKIYLNAVEPVGEPPANPLK